MIFFIRLCGKFHSSAFSLCVMQYPAYLTENKASLSADDFDRYTKQSVVVSQIVAKFDEPGADKEGPLSAAEEKVKAERGLEVIELVGKVS